MTRRQSNNEWSYGIGAHPATPQKFRVQNSAGKVLTSIFFWIKTASSSLIIFQRPNYQRGVILISAGEIEGRFEGTTLREGHKGGLVLARQCPGSLGTCNREETGLSGLQMS